MEGLLEGIIDNDRVNMLRNHLNPLKGPPKGNKGSSPRPFKGTVMNDNHQQLTEIEHFLEDMAAKVC